MMRLALFAALLGGLCAATPVAAQDSAASGTGAVLRILDKLNGRVEEVTLRNGAWGRLGRITVAVEDCRYPADNPTGDAYVAIQVTETSSDTPVFEGWIIASSPALHAMDHPRYDVWAMRCTTS